MESHISGPRTPNAQGSIVSQIIVQQKFDAPPQSGHDIFRTTGASPTNPVSVRGTVDLKTPFVGGTVKIESTNLQGGDAQDFILSGASAPVTKVFTEDRIFQGIYSGGASAGEVFFILECAGKGIREFKNL